MVVVSHLFPFYGKILPNYSHFNPRLREGGDSFSFDTSLQIYNFNPRLREGGDLQQQQQELIFTISIHASEKEATSLWRIISDTAKISIHASEKEATITRCVNNLFTSYFNPRLREGGDVKDGVVLPVTNISIHASEKEATLMVLRRLPGQ